MHITILYGTETGNAEMLAEDLAAELKDEHEVTLRNMADVDPAVLRPGPLHLIVSSTYGEGDVPASAKAFFEALQAERPNLAGVHFATFGLGDQTQYPETYARGSQRLEELFLDLGARRIADRGRHDASGPDLPEDVAAAWLQDVLAAAEVVS
jgi:MioC protein